MPVGWPPRFAVPEPPYPPREPPTLDVVEEAFLTKVSRGPLRTIEPPLRWLRGAVHDRDGVLLPASQRIGGLIGAPLVMADPERVRVRGNAELLEGTWLYGGHWIQHFGHFLLETLTTLWPVPGTLPQTPVGLVFHANTTRFGGARPWQTELLELAGWGDLRVRVVAQDPVRVQRLLLPSRALTINGWAHPEAVALWGRIADATVAAAPAETPERVFLSRTSFNAGLRAAGESTRTSADRDRTLDAVFAAAGFAVVTPEELPLAEQLRLAAQARVLAGSAGTALHLAAFARRGTRVIELADERAPALRVPTQQVIEAAGGLPSLFVPYAVPAADVARVLAALPDLPDRRTG